MKIAKFKLPGFIKITKHNVSETGPVSFLR
jgi:hypothetical protein